MIDAGRQELTQLLQAWSDGDKQALEKLVPQVQQELHRLAGFYMAGERPNHPLQTTALIHEAYIRLIGWDNVRWQNRAHFFGVAAQLMRRILVDHARAHYSTKRGGDRFCISLRNVAAAFGSQPDADLLEIHDALNRLEELDPDQARIVELRFFAGLTIKETAEFLKISHATVEREWKTAKAFLKNELTKKRHSF